MTEKIKVFILSPVPSHCGEHASTDVAPRGYWPDSVRLLKKSPPARTPSTGNTRNSTVKDVFFPGHCGSRKLGCEDTS